MKYSFLFFVLINLAVQAQQPWNYYVIDSVGSGADGIKLADINNDGRLDIATGWEESGVTKVYIQPEKDFLKHEWPAVIVGKTPHVEDAVFIDMNKDGRLEVLTCTEDHSQKIFIHELLENDPLNESNWKQTILPASAGVMSWMYAEPLQIDGKNGMDLLAAGKGENAAIGWFEAPVGGRWEEWHWHEISKVGWIMSILIEDMDADGDMDLVITDRKGKLSGCRWLENPGNYELQKRHWKNHFIGARGAEVMFMCVRDMNDDGEMEIIVPERTGNTIRLFSKQKKFWKEKIIAVPENTGRAKSVEAGDINKDGVMDLVLSTNTLKDERDGLIWLDGLKIDASEGNQWKSVSGILMAKYDKVELLDLDGDGDLDILICEENNGENSEGLGVIWYENPTIQ